VTKCNDEFKQNESIFCIGVEKHSDPSGQRNAMSKIIHGDEALDEEDGSIMNAIKMDSQAKHGLVSRGEAQVCL